MKKVLFFLLSVSLILSACKDRKTMDENIQLKKQIKELKLKLMQYEKLAQNMQFLIEEMEGVKARIVTNYGNIELKLFPQKAPLTCFNFITHAESGYYDGLLFHRVIKGFMIQGGDPNTRGGNVQSYGLGGPLVHIPHEFNDLKHNRGVVSMARPGNLAAGAGTQFFIVQQPAHHLDGQYTVFGKVTSGLDVVDKIADVATGANDLPKTPVKIIKLEVFK
ncbi:peptidylprolyl isomerase [Caldithrix abyssi]